MAKPFYNFPLRPLLSCPMLTLLRISQPAVSFILLLVTDTVHISKIETLFLIISVCEHPHFSMQKMRVHFTDLSLERIYRMVQRKLNKKRNITISAFGPYFPPMFPDQRLRNGKSQSVAMVHGARLVHPIESAKYVF